jgi:O-antigen/teichoic acid export membrane protein
MRRKRNATPRLLLASNAPLPARAPGMSDGIDVAGPDHQMPRADVGCDQMHSGALPDPERDAARQIRRKAVSAVAMVAGRDTVVKVAALLGNVAFARLLAPSSFGAVAFGLTVLMFIQLLSDGGLGVGLIRRPEAPHRDDLRVLLGYQLLLTTSLAVVVAAASIPFGRPGLVTAVMMPALPLLAFRAPSSIVFERNLDYAPLVRVEILEQLAYYLWGVGLVVLGAGVWGLATASVVRALVGTVAMLSVSQVARLAPSYSWTRLRPMLGFGIKFQAVGLANSGGLQLLNLGIVSIGGLTMLGLWTMAWRLAQIPYLLFGALWRVSYPATAQLLAAGEPARKMIERGLGLAAVGTGAILAPVTGSLSPLIPAMFGSRWAPVADVLPVAFFALQVSGPISVATAGYLYAVGDASVVLRAAAVTSIVWLVVALPLLPYLGLVAVGVGWMVSSLVEIPILSTPVRRRTGTAFLRPVLMPWIAASVAGASGWIVSRTVSHGLVAAFLGATVALCIYSVPIVLLRRESLQGIIQFASRAIRPNG